MNKTKRGLELAAAIISIVIGSLSSFVGLILLMGGSCYSSLGYYTDDYATNAVYNTFGGLMVVISLFVLGIGISTIILGAKLCSSPIKNGVIVNRFGSSIALIVLLGLETLFSLTSLLSFLFYATPLVLLIVSICLKHNKEEINVEVTEKNVPILTENNINNNQTEDAPQTTETIDSIESQLLKLKDLKDKGLIDENQYSEAVKKLLNKL